MSSYYTTAQLEAMRKERIRKEMEDSLKQLKEQLQKESVNTIQVADSANVILSVFASDDALSGYKPNQSAVISIKKADTVVEQKPKVEDLSCLLESPSKKNSKMEIELDQLIHTIDNRLILTEKDEKDRQRLLLEVQRIVNSTSMNIADKVSSVKMRVVSYLQSGTKKSKEIEQQIESRYYDYCALCKMLDTQPSVILPYKVEQEIQRLLPMLETRKQQEYIMGALSELLDELGCHVKEEAILDHTSGTLFSVDGHPLCDVFVGSDGSGIMFEPVGESKTGSLDRQRQIENSANSICELYSVLEDKALEKGIVLKRVYAVPSHIQEMCVRSDLVEAAEKKKHSKRSAEKQQAMKMED